MTDPSLAICIIENPNPQSTTHDTLALFNLEWLMNNNIFVVLYKDDLKMETVGMDEQINVVKSDIVINPVGIDLNIETVNQDLEIKTVTDDALNIEVYKE